VLLVRQEQPVSTWERIQVQALESVPKQLQVQERELKLLERRRPRN